MISDSHRTQMNLIGEARNTNLIHDPDFECFKNITTKPVTVMDVGANRGQSIVSLKSIFPDATILSFEANPFFKQILAEVATWYKDIHIHNFGLGVKQETLEFQVPVIDGVAYLEEGSTRPDSFEKPWVKNRLSSYGNHIEFDLFPVEIRKADDVVVDIEVDIVKLDVEGAELDVLSSMHRIIDKSHPIFLVENSDFENVTEFLRTKGYGCFQYNADEDKLFPLETACTNSFYIHPKRNRGLLQTGILKQKYSESEDFAEHRQHIESMYKTLGSTKIPPESRVLDVGGGQGMHACFLAAKFRMCWCLDVMDYQSLYNGEYYRLFKEKCHRNGILFDEESLRFIENDAMELLFRNEYFDFVTSFNAFEHIPDPSKALEEMIRVTKPGGVIYITFDPIWSADTGSHFIHRVPAPWAHLIESQEDFVLAMQQAESSEDEISDFSFGMNKVRLASYRALFRTASERHDIQLLHEITWSGLADGDYKNHVNFSKCLQLNYSEEELLMRGMCYVLRKI